MKKLICLMLATTITAFAQFEREVKEDFKISVIVPCHYIHAQYLPDLMTALSLQTYQPDEVVIALSKTSAMEEEDIQAVRDLCSAQSFPVKLLEFPMRRYTGFNRDRCARASSYELLVHNDADDLPHPKRLERIKWVFDNYDTEALVHSFHREGEYNLKEGQLIPFKRREMFKYPVHLGSVSFVKSLLEDVPWRDTHPGREDKFFLRESDRKRHRILILLEDLLYYRNHLSTWGENYLDKY